MMRPWRRVYLTRATAPMSREGSPSSTTRSASIPGAILPAFPSSPNRRAGLVVSEARMSAKPRPACAIRSTSSAVS